MNFANNFFKFFYLCLNPENCFMNRLISNILLSLSCMPLISSATVAETILEMPEPYPPEYAQQYLQDCQTTSVKEGLGEIEAKKLCDCTLREFQQKYSLREFKQINIAAATDENASNQLVEVGYFCFEELLYE